MALGGRNRWRIGAYAACLVFLLGCGWRLLPAPPTPVPTPTVELPTASPTPFFLQPTSTPAPTSTPSPRPTLPLTAEATPWPVPVAEPTNAPPAPAPLAIREAVVALPKPLSTVAPVHPAEEPEAEPAPTQRPVATRAPAAAPSKPATTSGCVAPEQAAALIGSQGCVEGTVTRLTYARSSQGSPTFADFGDSFTALAWIENRPDFPDIDSWRGKRLRVSGTIDTYGDKAQIILRSAAQVQVLG